MVPVGETTLIAYSPRKGFEDERHVVGNAGRLRVREHGYSCRLIFSMAESQGTMSKELRSAAERCLKELDGIHCGMSAGPGTCIMSKDVIALSEAWLAEHPADDDEPITEEWLRGVGFRETKVSDEHFRIIRKDQVSVCCDDLSSPTTWCMRGQEFLCSFKTRGDVRRLCAAIGIELGIVSSRR